MKQHAPHYDLDRGPRIASRVLGGSLAGFLIIAVAWMSVAELDISAQASGKVIPSSRVQLVQSLEGGIVRQLRVHEGQLVQAGDPLVYVENLQFDAELGRDQQTRWTTLAAIARLNAELQDALPEFSDELLTNAAEVVVQERSLWLNRLAQRDDAIEMTRRQIAQRREELGEAQARQASLGRQLALARETLAMEQKLLEQGAGARADVLRVQQDVERLSGELQAARLAVPRLQEAIEEANARVAQIISTYRTEASRELSELEGRLAALREGMTATEDRVQRRELRAPSDAVVNRLLINTIGGVARAGETIMELVPVEDSLLISVRAKPSDIAFIRPGQVATVRITAYDSSIFGSLSGKVVRVGADAIHDERQDQHYFEVFVETDRNYLGEPEERLTISAGMAADVNIHTGKRTLLEYLLKPIVKTFDSALRER